MSKNPWRKFKVGTPSTKSNWVEPDCEPLTEIYHVAHVPSAVRIVEDGELKADLIRDKSILNTERIRVVWLSPNNWDGAGGSRYGNIRFKFNWESLIIGKKIFWVENIAYGIEACRILITDNDYSARLTPYDPSIGDGPWWYRKSTNEHFWNGKFCLEIMCEGDMSLELVQEIDFVQHHEKRCCISPTTCRYRGFSNWKSGAEFIATIVSRKIVRELPGIVVEDQKSERLSFAFQAACSTLLMRCNNLKISQWGDFKSSDQTAVPLARAVIFELVQGVQNKDLKELAALFQSRDELIDAVTSTIASTFGIANLKNLLD